MGVKPAAFICKFYKEFDVQILESDTILKRTNVRYMLSSMLVMSLKKKTKLKKVVFLQVTCTRFWLHPKNTPCLYNVTWTIHIFQILWWSNFFKSICPGWMANATQRKSENMQYLRSSLLEANIIIIIYFITSYCFYFVFVDTDIMNLMNIYVPTLCSSYIQSLKE